MNSTDALPLRNSVSTDWYRYMSGIRYQNTTQDGRIEEIRVFINRLRERHWNSSESNDVDEACHADQLFTYRI